MSAEPAPLEFLQQMGDIRGHAARCIRCGFCNAACPTSNVESAFKDSRTSRGRLILLQSLVEATASIDPYSEGFKALIDLCYSCRRCVPVCPAGIPIPDLMSHARHAYLKHNGSKTLNLGQRLYANYGTFDRLGSNVAPLSNWLIRRGAVRRFMERLTHIDSRARIPEFHEESFESWFRKRSHSPRERKIAYFVDSYANYNQPDFARTVVSVLEYLGYEVVVPPQKESGMPAIEYGLLDKASRVAKYNLKQLLPFARSGIQIVCSSPAASYLLREGYSAILDDADSKQVSGSTVDIAELLLEAYEVGSFNFQREPDQKVTYHYCCLSKSLGLGPKSTELLREAGFDLKEAEECCGGAGVWGTFKENYEMSAEIAGKLRGKVDTSRVLLTESETCRMQLEKHTFSQVRFPLELLAPRIKGIRMLA